MKNFILGFFCIVSLVAYVVAGPLDVNTYVAGKATWIERAGKLFVYKSDSRIVRGVTLSDSLENDSILALSDNRGMLFILAKSGAYLVDMNAITVERVALSQVVLAGAKVSLDDDYGWLLQQDSLHRFDRLSREWYSFKLPSEFTEVPIIGIYSNGTDLYCLGTTVLGVFSISDEKWVIRKNTTNAFTEKTKFLVVKNTLVCVNLAQLFRYGIDAQTWSQVQFSSSITDAVIKDTVVYVLTASGVIQYDPKTSVSKTVDISDSRQTACFSLLKDTLVLATPTAFIKYSISNKTISTVSLPTQLSEGTVPEKCIASGEDLIALYGRGIAVFDPSNNTWEYAEFSSGASKRKMFSLGEEDGMRLRYSQSVASQLRGSVMQNFDFDMKDTLTVTRNTLDTTLTDTTKESNVYWGNVMPAVDLTLRTTFANEQFLDLHYNNLDLFRPADRWLYFRGNKANPISWLKAGTTSSEAAAFTTVPKAQFEGVALELQSAQSLTARDRKIVRVQSGMGFLTTVSNTEVLQYSETGQYTIKGISRDTSGNIVLVPGSLAVNIDGDDIDSSNFFFSPLTGDIQFKRRDLVDPSSIILVTYKLQTTPSNIKNKLEFIPENKYGDVAYVSTIISPVPWLTARAGVATVQPSGYALDTTGRRTIFTGALPLEFRKESPDLFMSAEPEISFEQSTKSLAGALNFQGRFFKRAGLSFTALFADTAFKSIDQLSRGYGAIKQHVKGKLSYDVLPELPVSYSLMSGTYAHGNESRQEIMAAAHFARMPHLELSLSKSNAQGDAFFMVKDTMLDSSSGTLIPFDRDSLLTLNRLKEKIRLRIHEASSPVLEQVLRCRHINYEVAWTGFRTGKESDVSLGVDTLADAASKMDISYGQILFMQTTVNPVAYLSVVGSMTSRNNPNGSVYKQQYDPALELQLTDAPPGVDIAAKYALMVGKRAEVDTTESLVRRSLNLTLRPGRWYNPLGMLSLRLGLEQQIGSFFDSTGSTLWNQITGEKYEHRVFNQEYYYLDTLSTPILDTAYPQFDLGHTFSKITSPSLGIDINPFIGLTFKHDVRWTVIDTSVPVTIPAPPPSYPSDAISFRDYNAYNFWPDLLLGRRKFIFRNFNDVKWFVSSKQMLQLRVEYDGYQPKTPTQGQIVPLIYTRGFFRFENTWASWCKSALNFGAGSTKNWGDIDTSVAHNESYALKKWESLSLGPSVSADFSLLKIGIVKKLANSHSMGIVWTAENWQYATTPSISYSLGLSAMFVPNFAFQTKQIFIFSGSGLKSYTGNIQAGMLF